MKKQPRANVSESTRALLAWGESLRVEGPLDDFLGFVENASGAIGNAPTTIVDAVHAAPSPTPATSPAAPPLPILTALPAAAPAPPSVSTSTPAAAPPASSSSGLLAKLSGLPWYEKIAIGGVVLSALAFGVDLATKAAK